MESIEFNGSLINAAPASIMLVANLKLKQLQVVVKAELQQNFHRKRAIIE
jgi:hypothetical protein